MKTTKCDYDYRIKISRIWLLKLRPLRFITQVQALLILSPNSCIVNRQPLGSKIWSDNSWWQNPSVTQPTATIKTNFYTDRDLE